MKAGSLFSGYRGLDMAVEAVLGAETVWCVENDPAASKVLALHWPGVPNHGDITRVGLTYSDDEWDAMKQRVQTDPGFAMPLPNWSAIEPVDALVGGFPCTDISSAGKRAGIEGKQSGLWFYFADAIRVLRPRYVFVENVGALVVRGLDRVLADFAELRFNAEWTAVRASAVGAPHRRTRIFIAAVAQDAHGSTRDERRQSASGQAQGGRTRANAGGRGGTSAANAVPEGCGGPGRGVYAPAIRRWERVLGRVAPVPTMAGTRGGQVLSPRFVEWMMGVPEGHVTDVPGLSRNDMLRMLGNGVCPQQAVAAYRYLLPLLTEAVAA